MRSVITLCVAVAVTACAAGSARFAQEMNAQVGKGTKSYFVDKYGPPDKQAIVSEGVEVWEYRLDEQKYTSSTGYRFSTFDRLRLTFTGVTLSAWKREPVSE